MDKSKSDSTPPKEAKVRRREDALAGTPLGAIKQIMDSGIMDHPGRFVMAVALLTGLAGVGTGVSVLPFVTQDEFKEHTQKAADTYKEFDHARLDFTAAIRDMVAWKREQCEFNRNVDARAMQFQLRLIEQEQWALQGVIDSAAANERDVRRSGELASDHRELDNDLRVVQARNCQ